MTTATVPEQTIVSASVQWNVPLPETLASRVRELLLGISVELLEREAADSVAMAAHELLENVFKYSAPGTSSFDVEIVDRSGEAFVRLRTRNPASSENLTEVRRLVERIGGAADPVRVYDELVATSSLREESGLGLARVRAEAEMAIACSQEGRLVAIVAERRVAIRKATR